METIQHQPKAITPCIRQKLAQSKEIDKETEVRCGGFDSSLRFQTLSALIIKCKRCGHVFEEH